MKLSSLFEYETIDELPELTYPIFIEKIRVLQASARNETEYDDDEFFLYIVARTMVKGGRSFVDSKNNALFHMGEPEKARKLFLSKIDAYDAQSAIAEAFKKELSQRGE